MSDRLNQQLDFLHEIDALKTIFRKTNLIADKERLENSAEHSWHLAMYVLVLAEYANEKIDILRVLKMVLLHDIVEIDAGDTFCYDTHAHQDKEEKEQQAAKRIFGLLPDDQANELKTCWEEFEAGETLEAKFASAIDRLQPLLHNYVTGGGSWKRHNIQRHQVEKRLQPIIKGSKFLADVVETIINESVERNYLLP